MKGEWFVEVEQEKGERSSDGKATHRKPTAQAGDETEESFG